MVTNTFAWRTSYATTQAGERSIDQSVDQMFSLTTYLLIDYLVNNYQWWHNSSLIVVDWLTCLWSICQWHLVHLICTLCQLLVYFGEKILLYLLFEKLFFSQPKFGLLQKNLMISKNIFSGFKTFMFPCHRWSTSI